MKTYTSKLVKNENRSAASESAHSESNSKPASQFVDNRPEAIAQRVLQGLFDDKSNQQIKQLKGLTKIDSNTSPANNIVQRQITVTEDNLDEHARAFAKLLHDMTGERVDKNVVKNILNEHALNETFSKEKTLLNFIKNRLPSEDNETNEPLENIKIIRGGHKRKDLRNTEPTNHEEEVNQMPGNLFVGTDFNENHICNPEKLENENPDSFAKVEAQRRGLSDQTVLFLNSSEIGKLYNEIKSKNASAFFYKNISKNTGIPAETFFVTNLQFRFITVSKNKTTEGMGRIVFTLKNLGKETSNGTPCYFLNHLEKMEQTVDFSTPLPTNQIEEEDDEYGSSDEYISDDYQYR